MSGTRRPTVMVSSTARDLPEHRKEVMDASLRQGLFPNMMEHLPAELRTLNSELRTSIIRFAIMN
jgi:hypothetical protein